MVILCYLLMTLIIHNSSISIKGFKLLIEYSIFLTQFTLSYNSIYIKNDESIKWRKKIIHHILFLYSINVDQCNLVNHYTFLWKKKFELNLIGSTQITDKQYQMKFDRIKINFFLVNFSGRNNFHSVKKVSYRRKRYSSFKV